MAYYFSRWKRSGKWRKILAALTAEERKRQGRSPEPSAVIIDSQSVKTTEKGGVKGYDAVKKIKGRKRFIATDICGNIIERRVVSAGMRDEAGGEVLIRRLRRKHPGVRVVYVDEGFKRGWVERMERKYGIEVKVLQKGRIREAWGTAESAPPGYMPFRVIPLRWIVERTFAWLGKFRRLSKDYEALTDTSETWIDIAMVSLFPRRNSAKS